MSKHSNNFSNNIATRLEGFIEALVTRDNYYPYEEGDYPDTPLKPIQKKNTPAENEQSRIAYQKPTQQVQRAIKDFSNKLETQFATQYEISKNLGGNNNARKAAIEIFANVASGLIPSKFGASGIEFSLGEGVKDSANTINEYLDNTELQNAKNIVNLVSEEDDIMRKLRKEVIEPFAKKIIRNYEDQVESLTDHSIKDFNSIAVDRIFHVLSHPLNPEFSSAHSKSNTLIERLNEALLCQTGSRKSVMTKDDTEWNVESMLTKPRIKFICQRNDIGDSIRIDEAIFAHPTLDRNDNKYGERWGTPQEAISLGHQKFDNRRQADNVLTTKLLESSNYSDQKIGKIRKTITQEKNKDLLNKSLEIEDSRNLSLYCKSLRKDLKEEFIKNPENYRNLNLISEALIQDLTLANKKSIESAENDSIVTSYSKSDSTSVIKYMASNPSSSISKVISATRTSPPERTSAKGFHNLKSFMERTNDQSSRQ